MKFTIIRFLRALGLLGLADGCKFALANLRTLPRNRKFHKAHPGFPTPPCRLAFDALNHVDWETYRQSGLRHAEVFARVILQSLDSESLDVLEWGCGPGRLIRHLAGLLAGRRVALTGADCNPASIDWCRRNLPGITFVANQLLPPLPLADGRFDVAYSFSVFTHLSEEAQVAWAGELLRVLRPGGLAICTTHGDRYRYLLASRPERRRYDQGQVVVQGNYQEGRKWFFAIQPPNFVREVLLKDFCGVRQVATLPEDDMLQDVWIGWKGKAPGR